MLKSKIEKAKNLIFEVKGGIGRNIFSTAVIRNLKKTYPDKNIFIICGFPEIFFNNPNVKRVNNFNNTYPLFEDYILNNKDSLMLDVEPYRHPEYISGNLHIVKAWCDLLEIDCDSVKPDLFFSRNEQDLAKAYLSKFKEPMILFQHIGGKVPNSADRTEQVANAGDMYRRSLREKTVQEVVDGLIKDGYIVGAVQGPNQFVPDKAERIIFPIRAVMALVPYVAGIICIDSFLLHTATAMDVKSLVLWAGTSPEKLGYDMHVNLRRKVCSTPECHRPNSFAYDVQTNGFQWDCPFGDVCRDYDATTILEEYKKMKGEDYTKAIEEYKEKRDAFLAYGAKPQIPIGIAHNHCPTHGR